MLTRYESNRQATRSLKSLIKSCLAGQPSDRPANATQVANRLHRVLNPQFRFGRWAAVILLFIVIYEVIGFFLVTATIE